MTTTTTAALLTEARALDAAATPGPWFAHTDVGEKWISHEDEDESGPALIPVRDAKFADLRFAARARTLLPQLADALVAAGTNCRALQDLYEEKRVALVAAEARLAKVREMAIIEEEFPSGYIGKRCLLCKGAWRYSAIEAHSDPVCPARPMEPTT